MMAGQSAELSHEEVNRLPRNWSYIIIHHTGAEEKDTAQVRRYHLSLGWQDIGYHYVIERDGKVVPGRSLELVGATVRQPG